MCARAREGAILEEKNRGQRCDSREWEVNRGFIMVYLPLKFLIDMVMRANFMEAFAHSKLVRRENRFGIFHYI